MVVFAAIVVFSWLEARGKGPAGRVAAATIALTYCGLDYLPSCSGHSTCISLLPL